MRREVTKVRYEWAKCVYKFLLVYGSTKVERFIL